MSKPQSPAQGRAGVWGQRLRAIRAFRPSRAPSPTCWANPGQSRSRLARLVSPLPGPASLAGSPEWGAGAGRPGATREGCTAQTPAQPRARSVQSPRLEPQLLGLAAQAPAPPFPARLVGWTLSTGTFPDVPSQLWSHPPPDPPQAAGPTAAGTGRWSPQCGAASLAQASALGGVVWCGARPGLARPSRGGTGAQASCCFALPGPPLTPTGVPGPPGPGSGLCPSPGPGQELTKRERPRPAPAKGSTRGRAHGPAALGETRGKNPALACSFRLRFHPAEPGPWAQTPSRSCRL